MKKLILLAILACLITIQPLLACTTAIISGKFTPDGRPLLWKNRDTGDLDNKLVYFSNGRYDYIGLVNSTDTLGTEVWVGMNTAGFSIMNSASYNLNTEEKNDLGVNEGKVIRQALQQCATVDDFELLLKNLPLPYGLEANFGVIDAQGNGAYFETSNRGYQKIDVNDPAVAPMGYLIRTNYSVTGKPDMGQGYIRYMTAEKLFFNASATNNLTPQFIIQNATRCLYHSLTETNLKQMQVPPQGKEKFVWFADFIPRFSSSASVVIQGVRNDESPSMTTMWNVLGFPLCSVVYPVWLNEKHYLPELLKGAENGNAPLCDKALKLKDLCFPVKRGHGDNYLNLPVLYNNEGNGIMQKLAPVEDHLFTETKTKLEAWRRTRPQANDIKDVYDYFDRQISEKYLELFGI